MNTVATLSYVSLLQLRSIQYQEETYEIFSNFKGMKSRTKTNISPPVFVLSTLKGAAKP